MWALQGYMVDVVAKHFKPEMTEASLKSLLFSNTFNEDTVKHVDLAPYRAALLIAFKKKRSLLREVAMEENDISLFLRSLFVEFDFGNSLLDRMHKSCDWVKKHMPNLHEKYTLNVRLLVFQVYAKIHLKAHFCFLFYLLGVKDINDALDFLEAFVKLSQIKVKIDCKEKIIQFDDRERHSIEQQILDETRSLYQ